MDIMASIPKYSNCSTHTHSHTNQTQKLDHPLGTEGRAEKLSNLPPPPPTEEELEMRQVQEFINTHQIPREDLLLQDKLGEGEYGPIYRYSENCKVSKYWTRTMLLGVWGILQSNYYILNMCIVIDFKTPDRSRGSLRLTPCRCTDPCCIHNVHSILAIQNVA